MKHKTDKKLRKNTKKNPSNCPTTITKNYITNIYEKSLHYLNFFLFWSICQASHKNSISFILNFYVAQADFL